MANTEIANLQRIFTSRLDTLSHILDIAEEHFSDKESILNARLAEDMLPFGTQIAFVCNQPLGFSQWCAGQPIENLPREVDSMAMARSHIAQTKDRVAGITVDDAKLEEIKRVGLGPGKYCELPARQYVDDFLMPNFYFHITTAYAILRQLGAPIGKGDFMTYLAPYVKEDTSA